MIGDIIHAQRHADVIIQLVAPAYIQHQIVVGKAETFRIAVAVIQTVIGITGVAQATAQVQFLCGLVAGQQVGTPAGNAGELLAFRGWLGGVVFDNGAGVGDVEVHGQTVHQQVRPVGDELDAPVSAPDRCSGSCLRQ